MTIEEIKAKWGSPVDGYIPCHDCPLDISECNPEFANGFQYCWAEIAKHYPDEPVTEEDNPYWERITALAERQRNKGMSKYGQGLEMNTADILERINHLQEELIDGLMYCEWIKDKLSESGELNEI